ncbi:SAM domain-containing protein [Caenorhabditis elegans]|uniref:Isoform a of Uncharacterized protein C05D10.4 n=1 Tax=Caenorhabditis elegans TaxID=6239 RepID=Q11181-2|nr:Uncharacterized protein CELE_C05D10.4 [Caenorhabditis elegans]CCD63177.1 Uncharacterized protein CELE_C05D10.4 [Caenorhabditis elegans]|eukprot:NP_498323.2 Uncharacterized protein CELE_C05D10.4 [Caenorhabditis elegans]
MTARPYEPPPDYPMIEQRWPTTVRNSSIHPHVSSAHPSYRSHSIDAAVNRSSSACFHSPHRPSFPSRGLQKYDYPICGVSPSRHLSYNHFYNQSAAEIEEMLRTRQFPEIAGIYGNDEQPSLRRFTRYNQSINSRAVPPPAPPNPPKMEKHMSHDTSGRGSIFSKSSKKPLFFMGNWTFRDRNKSARPSISEALREERPQSMNLSDIKPATRSKSGEVLGPRNHIHIESITEFPRNIETRVPVKIERSSMVRRKPSNMGGSTEVSITSSSPSPSSSSSTSTGEFKTTITVDDDHQPTAVMRPKKESDTRGTLNNNRYSFQSCVQLRKSCPDLDSTAMSNMEQHRVSKKRTRRAKEKMSQAAWKRKTVKEWSLDDVLLWLQSAQMDDVAGLLIGYDLRGEDLLQWNDQTLAQLGVSNPEIRKKLLDDLSKIIENGPEPAQEDIRNNHRTLFDIVKQTSYDQVLAVETPLTTRDITVTHGRLGCLQITKVNGANLPLKEHDCLLEINERAGEQFKSALMLTKLISDSNGAAIRFVVLRRKTNLVVEESQQKESSSSGISSSPQTPTE